MAQSLISEARKPIPAIIDFIDAGQHPRHTFGDLSRDTSTFKFLPCFERDNDEAVLSGVFCSAQGSATISIRLKNSGCVLEHGSWPGSLAEQYYKCKNIKDFPEIKAFAVDLEGNEHGVTNECMSIDFVGLPNAPEVELSGKSLLDLPVFQDFMKHLSDAHDHRQRIKIITLTSNKHVTHSFSSFKNAHSTYLGKLPVEIRSLVYDEAFQYPKTGLLWRGAAPTLRYLKTTVDFSAEQDFTFQVWDDARHRSNPDIVEEKFPFPRPLATSKRIHSATTAAFYGNNLFFCPNLTALLHLLRGSFISSRFDDPDMPKNFISNIAIDYDVRSEGALANQAFSALNEMKRLETLYVRINEAAWSSMKPPKSRSNKYNDPLKIPGVKVLRGVRLDKVTFFSCPVIEAVLSKDMMKESQKGSEKRKAEKDVEHEPVEPKKKKQQR